jgi:hypothetical protein
MHEQIVQKKVDGKIKLEKIQVPMKICKSINDSTIKKPKPKPDEPNTDPSCPLRTKTLCELLKNWQEQVKKNPLFKVDKLLLKDVSLGIDPVSIRIAVKGAISDFKPLDSSGKPIAMPKLTQEQRDMVIAQRKAQAESYQKDLIQFLKDNGGTITRTDYHINFISARVPSSLVDDIAERGDVVRISKPSSPKIETIQ